MFSVHENTLRLGSCVCVCVWWSSVIVCLGSPQEGKSIKSSSGFSGKGFKFDETEHALANERKKLQKAALGLHDSDDEDQALDVSSYHQLI